MILTTERVVVGLIAFGMLFFLQSRSRRVTDQIVKKMQEDRERRIDDWIEEERSEDYDQFELHPPRKKLEAESEERPHSKEEV